jgi:HSP20 family molecular chaperone IbpA
VKPVFERGYRVEQQRGIKFKRDRDQNGYHLRIYTKGYSPEALQVTVNGPFLIVENQESHQVENRYEQGYSFSTHSSSMRRRFRIPRDADSSAMQRSVQGSMVVITLPYRN